MTAAGSSTSDQASESKSIQTVTHMKANGGKTFIKVREHLLKRRARSLTPGSKMANRLRDRQIMELHSRA